MTHADEPDCLALEEDSDFVRPFAADGHYRIRGVNPGRPARPGS